VKIYKRAFVLGKFLPPHKGHRALIDLAASFSQHVVVAVEEQKNEKISVSDRAQIVRSFVPYNVSVKELRGHHPQSPQESASEEDFWAHWSKTIKSIACDVDVIVSSDDYGKRLADDLGADWIRCDRNIFPTSATKIKDNLWENFSDLVEQSQSILARRVTLLGAESTGKSTLAKNLSSVFDAALVPEYAEYHIKNHPPLYDKKFFQSMIAGQTGYRAAFGRDKKIIIEDSSAVTTALYAHEFGHVDLAKQILKSATESPPHLVIVSKLNGSRFAPDVHREGNEEKRHAHEKMLLEWLEKNKWNYVTVEGDWDERFQMAQEHMENFVSTWARAGWEDWTASPNQVKYKNEKRNSPKMA